MCVRARARALSMCQRTNQCVYARDIYGLPALVRVFVCIRVYLRACWVSYQLDFNVSSPQDKVWPVRQSSKYEPCVCIYIYTDCGTGETLQTENLVKTVSQSTERTPGWEPGATPILNGAGK